jgi:putative transposase
MSLITKSSTHTTKYANQGKQHNLDRFLTDYNKAIWFYVNYLWHNKIQWTKDRFLDIQNNKFDTPTFISTTSIPYTTDLSARALKLASGEALAIIKSQTSKRQKQLYVLKKKMKEGDISGIKKLQSKIDSNPLTQPTKTRNASYANLDSNCCQYISTDNEFDGFLKLKCLGKKYGSIYLPVKMTRHSNKFKNTGYELITSWQIGSDTVKSRWQVDRQKSSGTKIIGADQGLVTCLSLSDGQATTTDIHGHDLNSIIKVMTRKKKGSKAFKRCQLHRTNYINWSINQLDLSNVKEFRLEKLHQMRKSSRSSRNIGHWTYTAINAQIMSRCEDMGVPLIEQSATYRSQRCSDCGWTQKSNRKGKEFICKSCGSIHDADINGALNHEADLYRLPYGLYQKKLNRKGFCWLETGIFDSNGQELIVPVVEEVK